MFDDSRVNLRQEVDAPKIVALWFDRHAESVFGYVARRLGPQVARDVSADVFRSAIEGFASYDETKGTERAWLLGIATNHIRRHWRTESRRLRAMERIANATTRTESDPTRVIDDRLDANDRAGRLLDAVAGLPVEDRELLTLVAWEGCSYVEVGEILGIPAGTVGSRLSRIRDELRRSEGVGNG